MPVVALPRLSGFLALLRSRTTEALKAAAQVAERMNLDWPRLLFPRHLPEGQFVAAGNEERRFHASQHVSRLTLSHAVDQPPAPVGQLGKLQRSVHIDPLAVALVGRARALRQALADL